MPADLQPAGMVQATGSTCDALHNALNDAALGDAGGLDLNNLSAHDHA